MSVFDKFSRRRDIRIPVEILEATATEPEFVVEIMFIDGLDQEQVLDNSRGGRGMVGIDNGKHRKNWSRRVIKGWHGLTLGNLKRILPKRAEAPDEAAFQQLFPNGEIPYDEKTAEDLYRETDAADFYNKIMDEMRAYSDRISQEMKTEEAEARKNSVSSFDSSSVSG